MLHKRCGAPGVAIGWVKPRLGAPWRAWHRGASAHEAQTITSPVPDTLRQSEGRNMISRARRRSLCGSCWARSAASH